MTVGTSDGKFYEDESEFMLDNPNIKHLDDPRLAGWYEGDNWKPQPGGSNPHNSPDIKTIPLPFLPGGWPGMGPDLVPGQDKDQIEKPKKSGSVEGTQIAMEPFDPSSMAPLGVPHKVGGEGGAGGLAPKLKPAIRYRSKPDEVYTSDIGHFDAMNKLPGNSHPNYNDIEDGFVTGESKWLTRDEALEYGRKNELVDPSRQMKNRGLISEDLKTVQDKLVEKYAPIVNRLLGGKAGSRY